MSHGLGGDVPEPLPALGLGGAGVCVLLHDVYFDKLGL